jgi:hypothetical protein
MVQDVAQRDHKPAEGKDQGAQERNRTGTALAPQIKEGSQSKDGIVEEEKDPKGNRRRGQKE